MEELFLSIFPIIQDEGNVLSIAGTATLVECNAINFLITAAHVLKNNGNSYPLFVGIGDELIPIEKDCFAFMTIKHNNIDIDIAIFDIRLMGSIFDMLVKYGAKPISLDSPQVLPRYARSQYMAIGFPWRKSHYNKKKKLLHIKAFSYITDEANNKFYEKYHKPKDKFLIINYSRRKNQDSKGIKKMGPKPQGSSGGALIKVLANEDDEVLLLIFEGILIEWQDSLHIIATRKEAIKDFLIQNSLCI